MKGIFQSKYRRRIIAKIKELEPLRDEARSKIEGITQPLDPPEYAHWWCVEKEYIEKIELLKALLR
jgi:hypothetical protein